MVIPTMASAVEKSLRQLETAAFLTADKTFRSSKFFGCVESVRPSQQLRKKPLT